MTHSHNAPLLFSHSFRFTKRMILSERTDQFGIPLSENPAQSEPFKGQELTPNQYKNLLTRQQFYSEIKIKSINSVFTIYKNANDQFIAYHLIFSRDEFDHNATTAERANEIHLVGAFKSLEDAKKFAMAQKMPGNERLELARQKDFGASKLGFGANIKTTPGPSAR